MSEQLKSKNTVVEEKQKLIGLWAARIFTIIGLAFFSYSAYTLFFIQQGQAAIEDTVLLPITILMFVVSAISFFLIRGHRFILGIWLLVSANLIIPSILGVLVLRNIHPVVIIYLITLTTLLAFLVFPRASRWQVLTAAAVTILTIIGIEMWNPAFRGTTVNLSNFTAWIIALAFLGFMAFFIRQAWHGSLRTKLLTAFIGITVLATGALSIFVIITTTNNLRGNLERELTALTITRANRLGDLLDTQINTLTTLTLNNSLLLGIIEQNQSYKNDAAATQIEIDTKDKIWQTADSANNNSDPLVREHLTNSAALNLFEYQKTFPDNIEVFVTDIHGALVGTTNRTSDYYQADETWWQAAYNNGQGAVYISDPQLDESTGKLGIQFALPLRNHSTGTIIGILRTTYILTPLNAVLQAEIGETSETDMFIPGEPLIQIQDGELETPVPELFKQLQSAGQGMLEMDYEGEFSVVTQAPIQSLSGNKTINNLGWIVAFHQHRNEAFAPINAQIQGIIIVIAVVILLAVLAAVFIAQLLVRPLTQLTATAQEVAAGNLNSQAQVVSSDEIGTLASTFNTMTSRLRDSFATLEDRVAERTQSLELASEVGRTVSQVRSLHIMLKDAAELIRSRFDLYYVQVYLTNPSQTALILQSGTGTVGAELIGRAHKLELNNTSINGRAATEKHTVVISDTTASTTFKPNPLLPDTRSEMAVPLLIGEKVVGVLDLQSQQANALNPEILPAFEALAGQLAIAIQNATLLAEAEQARAEIESQARRQARSNWNDYMDAIHRPEETGFVFEQNKITLISEAGKSSTSENAVTAPIAVTGQSLGNLVVELEGQSSISRTTELVNTVANQVAQQIESLRLLDTAERYRFEAEEASHRLTREGWKDFKANTNEGLSYLYDLKEVRQYNQVEDKSTEDAYSLPLKVRDETVGKLVIRGLGSDDMESFELAREVAERLGAHIESLRQFAETKRSQVELDKRAHQLAAVANVSSVSSRELDIDKMLHSVVHLTQRQFGLYHAHVFIYDENTAELKIAACGYKEGDTHEGTDGTAVIPLAQEQSLVARSARTRQAVIVNDVHSELGWLPNPLLPDTASELAVPLVIGDQILGVLDVQSERINAFSEEDANIYATLASQVSTALQNAKSFSKSQQQAERESMLNTISQKIQSATTVEAVLQIAARELGHALGAPLTIAQLGMKDHNN